ncbi:zinc-binding dehydrogenase [Streptomyces sp. H10-C2]|uniref:zinc-binding dehydrogenase n=1 Tax=unclassified Streptomyces TaxID=2593676 RepID=UPI0024B9ACFD|nr:MULTISPECIES: zinc-binding dehydrogenase [unclassified Streptomyces]MDJ0345353.1 zinc-binding dehydrogenase [Streptomyces sp. PH10-H1]MDJ0374208.1 zinc-binding dehydrogenase [Streptomyces sp. H10-C2]
MRAARLHAFGPAENLTYELTETPEPGPGQVRIAVAAAGVHVIDTVFRQGDPKSPYPLPELPTIPGREVAGTVDALGEGTDPRWLGRRVVAHLGMLPGGYAEVAVTDAEKLHELPENVDFAGGIAMVGTGRTTLGILRFADLTALDVVIVTAAAGGIGSLLVQHAKNLGATVVGVAGGPDKADRVRTLGADVAVDYNAPDWTDRVRAALGGRSASIVFDAVSGPLGRGAVDLLGKGGRHLVYGWSGGGPLELGEEELAARGISSTTVVGPAMMQRIGGPEGMRALAAAALEEAAAGRLVPAVQRFPLAEAAAAHRALETRATMGKVVLIP